MNQFPYQCQRRKNGVRICLNKTANGLLQYCDECLEDIELKKLNRGRVCNRKLESGEICKNLKERNETRCEECMTLFLETTNRKRFYTHITNKDLILDICR